MEGLIRPVTATACLAAVCVAAFTCTGLHAGPERCAMMPA